MNVLPVCLFVRVCLLCSVIVCAHCERLGTLLRFTEVVWFVLVYAVSICDLCAHFSVATQTSQTPPLILSLPRTTHVKYVGYGIRPQSQRRFTFILVPSVSVFVTDDWSKYEVHEEILRKSIVLTGPVQLSFSQPRHAQNRNVGECVC